MTLPTCYCDKQSILDLAEFCKYLHLTNEGGADREEAYKRFTGNFEVGQTIEIAEKTYKLV